MEKRIQELLDKEEIRSIICLLCRAHDRRDKAAMERCYHPGAMEDHGAFFGDIETFTALAMNPPRPMYQRMNHNVGTINIELDGDVAGSEAYICAGGPLMERTQDGQVQVRVIYGRYIDRFERRNGEWRIAQRIVVKDWTDVRPVNDPDEMYPLSEAGLSDPVYTRTSPRLSGHESKK